MDSPTISRILDFRHENGINQYLVSLSNGGELNWVQEEEIPKGMDEEMFMVRKRRGELAKRRVFGKGDSKLRARKLIISTTSNGNAASSSDSDSSDASGHFKITTALSGLRAGTRHETSGTVTCPIALIEREAILTSLTAAVGCRSLKLMPHLLGSGDEIQLNEMFVDRLYGSRCGLSSIQKHFVDLMWTAILASPPGAMDAGEREKALEMLGLLVQNSGDVMTGKMLDEFLAESASEVCTLDSGNFKVLTRFCDLFIESRLKGLDTVEHEQSEFSKAAHEPNSIPDPVSQPAYPQLPKFSWTTSPEIDDEGIVSLVYKIYQLKNPEKLADVPGIIEKYKFQLTNLFGILMKKYEIVYSDLGDSRVFVPADEKRRLLGARLTEIFVKAEPSRLVDLEAILNFWIEKSSLEVAEYVAGLERSYAVPCCSHSPVAELGNPAAAFGFRALVREALAAGNACKLHKADFLLAKYAGKENFLYLAICDKYGVPVDEARFALASAAAEAAAMEVKKERMRAILGRVYSTHNPTKTSEIDKLMEKFTPVALFNLVVAKYKISLVDKLHYLADVSDEIFLSENALLVEMAKSIRLILELETLPADGLFVRAGVPSTFLQPFTNPLLGYGVTALEAVVRAPHTTEALLRDVVENKLLRVRGARVTAQEPEFFELDTFAATETARASCVASLTKGVLGFSNLVDFVHSNPTYRMHTLISTGAGVTGFIGDFRTFLEGESPSLIRSRFRLWASVGAELSIKLVEEFIRWPKWLRQCSVFVDAHSQTVALVGSVKHPTSFAEGEALISGRLGLDPYLSVSIPKRLCLGGGSGGILSAQIYDWSDATFHESADDVQTEAEEPTETVRPLRLRRRNMRDSYLQGQLCLNCDETTHKPTECHLKRKVCWNCHGSHSGSACVYPCRFCKGKHAWGVLECVKKGAKRIADWVKSRSCVEQRGLSGMVDDVTAKVNSVDPGVVATLKSLAAMGVDLDLVSGVESAGGNTGSLSTLPAYPPPPLPDSKYKWSERIFLDDLLSPTLIGRDLLRLATAQKGAAFKQLETRENCKLLFRGANAKEVFTSGSTEIDLRFHVLVLCDSPAAALRVKRVVVEIFSKIESGLAEGSIPKPPIVEGFSFLEKVASLAENVFQFDFLNLNAAIELDLKTHFEYVGELRHWLHRRGVEVELGDEGGVRIPSSGKVDSIVAPPLRVDGVFVDVFNGFFDLVSFWTNAPPASGGQYWFEPFELEPVGLLSLSHNTQRGESFESGQVVRLSEWAIAHFARLLRTTSEHSEEAVRETLACLKGVVRCCARNARLLMYLRHPWVLSTSTGTRDVPESFDSSLGLTAQALRKCGRLGQVKGFDTLFFDPEKEVNRSAHARPGDSLLARLDEVPETELPYAGYIVDWVTPREVTDYLSQEVMGEEVGEPIVVETMVAEPPHAALDVMVSDISDSEDLHALSVAQLRDRLREKDLPLIGRKADLIERIQAASETTVAPIKTGAKTGKKTDDKNGLCRVELPKALMKWTELVNNLTGPNNAHFAHIQQQCPSAVLVCLGSASAALVGEARLHVQLTAGTLEDFKKAKSLVEDLVRAVVDVGVDVCLADDPPAVRTAALREVKVVTVTEPLV